VVLEIGTYSSFNMPTPKNSLFNPKKMSVSFEIVNEFKLEMFIVSFCINKGQTLFHILHFSAKCLL